MYQMSEGDITNMSIGDSLLIQMKYLIKLFRKIKKNYDLIDRRQRFQINNNQVQQSHLKIKNYEYSVSHVKSYNPFRIMTTNDHKPTLSWFINNNTDTSKNKVDLPNQKTNRIKIKSQQKSKKSNQDTRYYSLPVIEEEAEDKFYLDSSNYEIIPKFNMIKLFSRHIPDSFNAKQEKYNNVYMNEEDFYNALLKHYYIVPLDPKIFDEQFENICINTGNGDKCYFDFNSGRLLLDINKTKNLNKLDKCKKYNKNKNKNYK